MKVKASIILGMFALTTALAACGSNQESVAYCVDQAGVVVDEDYCDPDDDLFNDSYLLWHSSDSHKYKKGKKIPNADFRKGSTSAPGAVKSTAKSNSGSAVKPKPQGSTQKPKAQTQKPAGTKKK